LTKVVYTRNDQTIVFKNDDGIYRAFECRDDFVPGENEEGQPHESLPNGDYFVEAEEYGRRAGNANGPAYGTFYIKTGDPRGRDIHGGGSGLTNPFAPRQGWVPTYGCLRMQNEEGKKLSQLIIDSGNAVLLEVRDE